MKDWIEAVVLMQPLARKLEEQLNRREYYAANESAKEMEDLSFKVRLYCAKHLED